MSERTFMKSPSVVNYLTGGIINTYDYTLLHKIGAHPSGRPIYYTDDFGDGYMSHPNDDDKICPANQIAAYLVKNAPSMPPISSNKLSAHATMFGTYTARPRDIFVYYTLCAGMVLLCASPVLTFTHTYKGNTRILLGPKSFAALGALWLGAGAVFSHF